jgi:hypothetical protein
VEERSSQYYGWDGLLWVVDRKKRHCITGLHCDNFEFGSGLGEPVAVFEEYRYDALGRRVMVQSRPDPRCTYTISPRLDCQVELLSEAASHKRPVIGLITTTGCMLTPLAFRTLREKGLVKARFFQRG